MLDDIERAGREFDDALAAANTSASLDELRVRARDAARRLEEGAEPVESIVEAARSRFVPIVMTSLATVIGLIPTAFGLEHGT